MRFRHAEHIEEIKELDEVEPDFIIEIVLNEGFLAKNEDNFDEARELSPEEYNIAENEEEQHPNHQELTQRILDNMGPKIP